MGNNSIRDITANLVIQELSDSEAALRERVVDLEADVRSYREMAQEALTMVRRLTLQNTRLQQFNADLGRALRAARQQRAA